MSAGRTGVASPGPGMGEVDRPPDDWSMAYVLAVVATGAYVIIAAFAPPLLPMPLQFVANIASVLAIYIGLLWLAMRGDPRRWQRRELFEQMIDDGAPDMRRKEPVRFERMTRLMQVMSRQAGIRALSLGTGWVTAVAGSVAFLPAGLAIVGIVAGVVGFVVTWMVSRWLHAGDKALVDEFNRENEG